VEKVGNLRAAILTNLLLNEEFKSKYTKVEKYDHFFEMLKRPINQADENLIAQHICALHMSKMKFSFKHFVDLMCKCSSILSEGVDAAILQVFVEVQSQVGVDVAKFFKDVMKNSKVQTKLNIFFRQSQQILLC